MAEQLALTETPPPPASPWDEMRALHPGALLVRVIDATLGRQYFMRLEPKPGAAVYDGATVVIPAASSDAAREAAILAADSAWHAHPADQPRPTEDLPA